MNSVSCFVNADFETAIKGIYKKKTNNFISKDCVVLRDARMM